jgi:hypothetical protein
MRAGHGDIPPGLRLPLPAAMRPDLGNGVDPDAPVQSRRRSERTHTRG